MPINIIITIIIIIIQNNNQGDLYNRTIKYSCSLKPINSAFQIQWMLRKQCFSSPLGDSLSQQCNGLCAIWTINWFYAQLQCSTPTTCVPSTHCTCTVASQLLPSPLPSLNPVPFTSHNTAHSVPSIQSKSTQT